MSQADVKQSTRDIEALTSIRHVPLKTAKAPPPDSRSPRTDCVSIRGLARVSVLLEGAGMPAAPSCHSTVRTRG